MKKLNTEEFIKRSSIIHNNKYDYSKVFYVNNDSKIIIGCKKHGYFEQEARNHLNGHGCFKRKNHHLTSDEFIMKSKEIHLDKYIYDKSEFKGFGNPVIIGCSKHGYFEQLSKVHLNGHGCPKCANGVHLKEEIIEICKKLHKNKYTYDDFEFDKRMMETFININCPKHGKFIQRLSNHTQMNGCPNCNESKGEKKIKDILEERGIDYIRQKKFENCKNTNSLPFDFFLPDKQLCIEFDGIQHFEPIYGIVKFKRLKENDNIKTNFCAENNINLVRIKYDENVAEIIEKI